jgi:arabinose-5-phosphate isomerase
MDNTKDREKKYIAAAVDKLWGTEADIIGLMREKFAGEGWPEFNQAVEMLSRTSGRVILTGMGKSGHVGVKITATMASLGTPAHFVHAAEASHGDLGMIIPGDTVIAISNSGNTGDLIPVYRHCERDGIPVIGITMEEGSTLGKAATIPLIVPKMKEGCILGLAPTTSTTAQMALGDALAVALAVKRDFTRDDFNKFHPGGSLGKSTKRVEELMLTGDAMPVVGPDMRSHDIPMVMASKSVNVVGVVDEDGDLVGLISFRDVDHRSQVKARKVMRTVEPVVVPGDSFATAIARMQTHDATGCFVVEGSRAIGFIRGES